MFLEHFDIGMATTLGAELITQERDGEPAEVYAVLIAGVTGPDSYKGLIPVIMSDPEDAFEENLLPQIVISRGAINQDRQRWHPGGWEYQIASPTAESVPGPGGKLVPNRVERKWWTMPYEISYDVHLRARLRRQADIMLMHVGRFFHPTGQVFLRDSKDEERGYYAFQDSIDNLSEIADVADRLHGHTISLRVEGELDFGNEPHVLPTAQKVNVNLDF